MEYDSGHRAVLKRIKYTAGCACTVDRHNPRFVRKNSQDLVEHVSLVSPGHRASTVQAHLTHQRGGPQSRPEGVRKPVDGRRQTGVRANPQTATGSSLPRVIGSINTGEQPDLLIGGGGTSVNEGASPADLPVVITDLCPTSVLWFGAPDPAEWTRPFLTADHRVGTRCSLREDTR